jgi:simple sugar transport system permease protein
MMRESLRPIVNAATMVVVALLAVTVLFSLSGYGAADILSGMLQGAFTAPDAWQNTARWTAPLLLMGCGVAVSFRAGYFNVGAQGQLYLGALAAYVGVTNCPGPGWLGAACGLLAGMIGGAAWASIAAVLRLFFGTDETLSTLMLNFIGVLVLQYAVNGPLRDTSGSGQAAATGPVPAASRISGPSGLSLTIVIIAVVVAASTWILINRSRFGMVATLAGRNPAMVRWQGASTTRLTLGSFAFAGALSGLAGATEVLGPTGRVVNGFSPSLGFTAVLVALVGILTVFGAVLAAVFFGALAAAVQYLPIMTDLPSSAFDLLQGVVAVLVTVQFGRVRRRRRSVRPAEKPPVPAAVEANVS